MRYIKWLKKQKFEINFRNINYIIVIYEIDSENLNSPTHLLEHCNGLA